MKKITEYDIMLFLGKFTVALLISLLLHLIYFATTNQ